MRTTLFFIALILITSMSFAQRNKKKNQKISEEKKSEINRESKMQHEEFEDTFREEEEKQMTLRFIDAKTGNGVQNATVTIQDIGDFTTDMEGKIVFPNIEKDQIILCQFKCNGYITATFKTEVIAGTLFYNRFTVSPVLKLGSIRIVLDWDSKPGDLDSHLEKKNVYHISYRNAKIAADGQAMLDRDDMDGYGPETITAMEISSEVDYEYFVHDYTNQYKGNSDQLSKSRAHVMVYGNNKLMNEFSVPTGQSGTKWNVFKISGGQIVPVNSIGN